MAAQTILIIRHAEKPVQNGAYGVDESGAADTESLTPAGWQRRGMGRVLCTKLGPRDGAPEADHALCFESRST